eukprot:XP_027303660.1 uncharacterized protein LOC113841135 isoform X4 [Anas platyrhynchos]
MNRGEPPKLRRHGSFVGRWLGMYAAMRADDAGPSTDLQTLRERLAMGKTQKTTRRISQNPTMLSRQEGLLLFNPPDGWVLERGSQLENGLDQIQLLKY